MIIAICGGKCCGKDTIANIISDRYGFQRVKIEKNLEVCTIILNFSDEQMESDTKDVSDQYWGITPRHAMQFIGTEVMQFKIQELLPNIGRNIWITSLLESMKT